MPACMRFPWFSLPLQVLGSAEVVCATCVGSGGEQLAGISFPLVVLDEGSQCSEPEALIPLTKVGRWVTAGRMCAQAASAVY
jgi:regulator of nonsense transcripts 1